MSQPDVEELGGLLLRRRDCLGALVDGGAAKRDLVEQLDCSRSTLDRVLRELNEAGLVRYTDGTWSLTPVGRSAQATQERYLDRLGSLAAAAAVLDEEAGQHVPERFLDGVEVFEPDPSVPDAVLEDVYEGLGEANRVRGLATQTIGAYTKDLYEAFATEPITDLETVIDPSMFAQIQRLYPDLVEGAIDLEHIDLYSGEVPLPFSLWISEGDTDRVRLVLYTDTGLRGVLQNDSEAAIEWATDEYERIRERAEQIDLTQDEPPS